MSSDKCVRWGKNKNTTVTTQRYFQPEYLFMICFNVIYDQNIACKCLYIFKLC